MAGPRQSTRLLDRAWTWDPAVGGSVLPDPLAQRPVQTRVTARVTLFRSFLYFAQLTPTIGSRSAPGASSRTTGEAGRTGSIRS
jgi:hypothetical protein